jgi:hypothetical protein
VSQVARLYANENFPLQVVLRLRELGHDVLTTRDANQSDRATPDSDVLRFAIEQERAVVTLNRRDFIRLHNENQDHFGIIVCTVDADAAGQTDRIDAKLRSTTDLRGQLIRINRPQSSPG